MNGNFFISIGLLLLFGFLRVALAKNSVRNKRHSDNQRFSSYNETKEEMKTSYEQMLNQWQKARESLEPQSTGKTNKKAKAKTKTTLLGNSAQNIEEANQGGDFSFPKSPQSIFHQGTQEEQSAEGKSMMEEYQQKPMEKKVEQRQRGDFSKQYRQGSASLQDLNESFQKKNNPESLKWRQAVVMSEILNKPLSLRKRA